MNLPGRLEKDPDGRRVKVFSGDEVRGRRYEVEIHLRNVACHVECSRRKHELFRIRMTACVRGGPWQRQRSQPVGLEKVRDGGRARLSDRADGVDPSSDQLFVRVLAAARKRRCRYGLVVGGIRSNYMLT